MRISDWSSDVCSSDLSNQPFPRPGLPLGPAPMTDGPTVTLAADFPAITLDDVRAAADRINGAVVRTPTLKSQTLSEMVGAEVWLKFENLQFRSEEHTSELQSLMRISYAVFGLKKNK